MSALTDEQIAAYGKTGYTVLRGLFPTDAVEAWQAECRRLLGLSDLIHPDNLRTRPRKINGALVLERFDPVVDISPPLCDVANDRRILDALRDLYDEEMRLFKDKLIFKLPGMSGYGIHQDFSWWQPYPQPLVSVMVAIDGADRSNGALEVFPGYHDRLLSTPGETRNMNAEEAKAVDPARAEMLETEPGDVAIFDCLTPHRSGPNTSYRSRQQFYLSYSAARHGDLYGPQQEHYWAYSLRGMDEATRERVFLR